MQMKPARAIIGLGNPGDQFVDTRHNAGFRVLEVLASRFRQTFSLDSQLHAEVALLPSDPPLYILKPQTGMNDSGLTVAAVIAKYDLSLENVLVVYDDVMMPMGRLRFQHAGSAGGHHGIESTIAQLGGRVEFSRLKVAVGPDPGGANRFKFVLAPMEPENTDLYGRVLAIAADACLTWANTGVQKAMSAFNGTRLSA